MAANTRWWFCGECGFENRPRKNQDNSKCEQCGHSQTDAAIGAQQAIVNDKDFTPTGGVLNA